MTEAELALDENGKFLGLRVNTLANIGGYISTFGPNIPTNLYGPLLAGVYTTPAIYCEVKVVFTNTVPVDAYRGAGRPEATFVLERLVDVAASEMGIDRAEIRRRNMIPKEAYPYQTPVMVQYDCGDPEGCLEKALPDIRLGELRQRKQASAKQRQAARHWALHLYRGLRPGAVAHRRPARRTRRPLRKRNRPRASDRTGHRPDRHAQSRPGTRDDLRANRLRKTGRTVRKYRRRVSATPTKCSSAWAPTARARWSSAARRSSKASDKIIAKGKKIAAHLLESSEEDIEFEAGEFKVAGTDRKKAFADIALAAYVPHNYPLEVLEPGLEEQAYYDPVNFTYPGGAHVAEVEIDPETGIVSLVNYTAVDDVGTRHQPDDRRGPAPRRHRAGRRPGAVRELRL